MWNTGLPSRKTPKEGNLKQSEDYVYKSSIGQVIVKDKDLKKIVSIYNETINKSLYVLGNEDFPGTITGNEICYSRSVSGSLDTDDLYILYKPIENDLELEELHNIKQGIKELNKSIKKLK